MSSTSVFSQPTVWIHLETYQERIDMLLDMLQKTPEKGGLKGEKTIVYVNTAGCVERTHAALKLAGVSSVPYRKPVQDERLTDLGLFRRYNQDEQDAQDTVPVLVCTDISIRCKKLTGVTVVVQLQLCPTKEAYVHRMGQLLSAGQQTRRGIVFYSSKEAMMVEVLKRCYMQAVVHI